VPAVAIATIALACGLDTLPDKIQSLNALQVIIASFSYHRRIWLFLEHIHASVAKRTA